MLLFWCAPLVWHFQHLFSQRKIPSHNCQPASSPCAYLEQFVLFAQVNRLLPAVVALVEVGGNAAELDQLVLLEALREGDVIKVVVGVDGGAQTLVVLLLDEEVVKGLVDGLVVVLLYGAQVRLYKRHLVSLKAKSENCGTL